MDYVWLYQPYGDYEDSYQSIFIKYLIASIEALLETCQSYREQYYNQGREKWKQQLLEELRNVIIIDSAITWNSVEEAPESQHFGNERSNSEFGIDGLTYQRGGILKVDG